MTFDPCLRFLVPRIVELDGERWRIYSSSRPRGGGKLECARSKDRPAVAFCPARVPSVDGVAGLVEEGRPGVDGVSMGGNNK